MANDKEMFFCVALIAAAFAFVGLLEMACQIASKFGLCFGICN